ncbi:MAG: hypothetical protein RR771_09540 [Acinetobacter sp.]
MELEQNQLAQIEQSVSIEQIQLSEKVGVIKATSFFKKLLTVSEIKFLSEIKETKQYKGLKVLDSAGKLLTVSTWAEFCDSMGKSHQHVDEEIRNLGLFGEDFLETSQRMSLGYRDLRKLRKLDDADREVIINGEAVKTEDRESLIDLIEEMSAKHAKEKETFNKKVADLEADVEAKDQVLKTKNDKLDKTLHELTKLKSPVEIAKREESEPQLIAKKALDDMHALTSTMLNTTTRFVNDTNSILEVVSEHMLFHVQELITQNLVSVFQQIAQTATDLNIQIDFEEMVSPVWTLGDLTPSDTDVIESEA